MRRFHEHWAEGVALCDWPSSATQAEFALTRYVPHLELDPSSLPAKPSESAQREHTMLCVMHLLEQTASDLMLLLRALLWVLGCHALHPHRGKPAHHGNSLTVLLGEPSKASPEPRHQGVTGWQSIAC